MATLDIGLQPKQCDILEEVENGEASWIGIGGGRGAAKSSGLDRVALTEMFSQPGIICALVMRTASQVRKYHIEPILRTWPELADHYAVQKGKLKIPVKSTQFSELDIGYAENYDAVENFFRSGNYKYIIIDQAEQFTEKELREIKKACRWPGGGAKMILAFNMGGVGIGFLRKIFRDKEYNDRENPANYKFIKVNPWDNCFWVTDALKTDGLTADDYYSWTEQQRMEYAGSRGEYTTALNRDDDALRARDWFGSWESLEGAYFGRVFGPESILSAHSFASLVKPWWRRWMSGDWGFGHWTSYYWHTRGQISTEEALRFLGVRRSKPLSVVITYKEFLGQGMAEADVARTLLQMSDDQERGRLGYDPMVGVPEKIGNLYFSPDAFEPSIKRSGQNSIADELGKVLQPGGLPYPTKANNKRVTGWRAMYGLLAGTKAISQGKDADSVWLITENCHELLKAIPLAMRDPKNIEDVLKTDKTDADISQDALDGARYGMLCREVVDALETQESKNSAVLDKCPTPQDKYLYSMMLPKTGAKKTFKW